jgi:hypothetical protein
LDAEVMMENAKWLGRQELVGLRIPQQYVRQTQINDDLAPRLALFREAHTRKTHRWSERRELEGLLRKIYQVKTWQTWMDILRGPSSQSSNDDSRNEWS